jgi:hypothetical protein
VVFAGAEVAGLRGGRLRALDLVADLAARGALAADVPGIIPVRPQPRHQQAGPEVPGLPALGAATGQPPTERDDLEFLHPQRTATAVSALVKVDGKREEKGVGIYE